MVNNFDMSSSGINLSLDVFYDGGRRQDNFTENFTSMGGASDHFQYIDHGNFETRDLSDLSSYSYRRKDITSALLALEPMCAINEWSNHLYEKSYGRLLKDEAADLLYEVAQSLLVPGDIVSLYREHLTPNFHSLTVRGFCQGDVATVILFADDLTEYEYDCENSFLSEMTECFENIFYRAPVGFSLDVGETTVDYEHIELDSEYEWCPDEFVSKAMGAIASLGLALGNEGYIAQWLNDRTPSDPHYAG